MRAIKNIYKKATVVISFLATATFFTLSSCNDDSIEVTPFGNISGQVVAAGTFEPIENVKISTNPVTTTAFSDAEGMFLLEDIPEENYSVQAEQEGLLSNFEGVTVVAGTTINVIFEMQPETANNRPPNPPILLSPEDNASEQPLELDLVWSGSDPDEEDTLTYTVSLRNDKNDDEIIFESLTDTMQTVTGLTFGTKYFWQVSANDGVNEQSTTSDLRAFTTTSIPENRFVYARQEGTNSVIFSNSDADDAEELQLTPGSANSWRPRRNAVTNRIAFLQSAGAQTHIFAMDVDGSNVTQVTSSIAVAGFNPEELDFAWSKSGDQLLYPNFDKLYRINADGSGLSQIYQTTDGSLISEVDWSDDGSLIALKTNDVSGYNVSIFTIDGAGVVQDTILTGVSGAAGGLNISVDNNRLLYTYDVSGFESADYRRLDTHIFMYDLGAATTTDISVDKPAGFNDLDPRFSPNEAQVIFTFTSNDNISQKDVYIVEVGGTAITREMLFANAMMADYE